MNDVSHHEAWGYYAVPVRVYGTEKYIAPWTLFTHATQSLRHWSKEELMNH